MNIINKNIKKRKKYLPYELKARLNVILTYRNSNSINFVCKKYLKRSNQIPMAILGYKTPLEKKHELLFSLPNSYNTFISLVNAI